MARKVRGNDDPRGEKAGRRSITSRMNYGRAKNPDSQADWGLCDPTVLQALIAAVTEEGGAILLGYSRDRGSYRVIVMDDAGKEPVWFPCTTDIDEALKGLIDLIYEAP